MIRVLHILHSMNRGGIETFLMNIYRNVDRGEVQFDFLLHVDEECAYDDEIIAMGGKIFRIPGRRQGIQKNRRALDSFFSEHTEYKIVHQHVSSLSYIEPLRIAARKNIPVRIIHSHNTMEGGGKFHKYLHLWNQRDLEQYATDFLACSEPAALWICGQKRFKMKKYMIIKNGINTKDFSYSRQNREKIRDELGIKGEKVIGHIGRFSPQKNHTFLIDIFNYINKKDPDIILLLVGDGNLRQQIQNKVNRLGLQDRVIFTGIRADVPDLYCAMDVFLFPSLYEGLGMVLVEAQAAGLPCVVSEKGIPEEVKLNNNLLFISLEKKPEWWAAACLEAVNGKRILTPSVEEYDIKKVGGELAPFYRWSNLS